MGHLLGLRLVDQAPEHLGRHEQHGPDPRVRTQKYSIDYGGYWGQGLWTSTHALVYDPNPASGFFSPDWVETLPNAPAAPFKIGGVTTVKVGYAWSISSMHPGGVNTAFADGSVRFIKNSISPVTWFALQTIANGEVVSADSY